MLLEPLFPINILKTLLTLHVSYYYLHKIFDPFLKYFCSLALESILFNFQHIFTIWNISNDVLLLLLIFSFACAIPGMVIEMFVPYPLCSIMFNVFAHTTLSHAKCNKYIYCTCILHIAYIRMTQEVIQRISCSWHSIV